MGEPSNPEILGPQSHSPTLNPRQAGRGGQRHRTSGLQVEVSEKWRKGVPQTPPPPVSEHPGACFPPLHRGPQAGLWQIPAHPTPEVLRCYPSTPKAAPPCLPRTEERGQRAGGATSRDLPVAERRPTGSGPGHPRGAQTGGGGESERDH